MRLNNKTSLADRLPHFGVLEDDGRGYLIRKDGAISIIWRIDAGNFLRLTEADYEQATVRVSKLLGVIQPHTQVEFWHEKYHSSWRDSLPQPVVQKPAIAKLAEMRDRALCTAQYFEVATHLVVTFNYLIEYKPPQRFEFFYRFLNRPPRQLTQLKLEKDIRSIEQVAEQIQREFSTFTFQRLGAEAITKLLQSYYNLSGADATHVRSEYFNGDLVNKGFELAYGDLAIGLDHVLTASMVELPGAGAHPVEADKRFLKSPLQILLSLPFPLRLIVKFDKLTKEEALRYIQINRWVNKPRFNTLADAKMAELEGLTEEEGGVNLPGIAPLIELDQDSLVDLSLTLMTWDVDRHGLTACQEQILSAFATFAESKAMIEVGVEALNVFLSGAPGNYLYRRTKVRSEHAGHFVNFSGHYKSAVNSGVPFISTNGALVYYDLFSIDNLNYNSLIIGPSGSGKSFFANCLITKYIEQAVPVVILDLSGSYRPLADAFKADYVAIDSHKPNQLDPFRYFGPDGARVDTPAYMEAITCLQSFLILMLKEEQVSIGKGQKAVIFGALERFFQTAGNTRSIRTFESFLRNSGAKAFGLEERLLHQLLGALDYYLGKSAAKPYFAENNSNLLEVSLHGASNMIVFDLKGIEQLTELMPLYANILSMLVLATMHRDYDRSLFIMDEAWKALDRSSQIYELVKETGRTARKHYGSIVAITQNIADLQKGDLAASILTNSHSKFLLRHTGEDVEAAITALDMTVAEQRAFRNIREREVLLCRAGEPILFKLPFSRSDYWLWTTRPDEVNLRNQSLSRQPTIVGAISELVETGRS
jgi:type IV secretory pathway VirB4 component